MARWTPQTIATGLGFPEGPVWLGDGRLAWTEVQGARLAVWDGADARTLARTGGGPNGATLGRDGALYVTNNGGLSVGPGGYWHSPDPIPGRVQRVTLDGDVSDFVVAFPGVPAPHRPNDCCFGPDGRLYFTDPANWEDLPNLRPGRIWVADGPGRARLEAEVPSFPNGIGFSADGGLLLVAQSLTMTVLALAWSPDGLGEPREFAALPAGFPDGFAVSVTGDLYVCGSMGDTIVVFDADGAVREVVELPEGSHPTNCCFGDDGRLYVTCSGPGEIVAFDLGVEGMPLFPARKA